MNNNRPISPPPGMSLGDVYYTIFRHKWKIVITSLIGLLAAAVIYHFKAPLYESQAELLIKYVTGATPIPLEADNQKVIVPDSDGEDVINAEIKILTSMDVAEEAASNFGPERVLAKVDGASSIYRAAGVIRGNLDAEPADIRSSVIVITLKHADPQIVQPLLQAVIDAYQQKHYEIHSAGGQFEDALTMEQSELSVRLNATEQQLADLRNKFNIISLPDSQKDLAAQLSKVNDEILDARAELSADEASAKQSGDRQSPDLETTNRMTPSIPEDQIDSYTEACASLETFRKKEQDYLGQGFTRSNSLLQGMEEQIATRENEKSALEKKYPQIAGVAPVTASTGSTTTGAVTDPRLQLEQVVALKAKIQTWETQLSGLQTQATNLNNLAPMISQLQETESILEADYQTLSVSLERSRIDEQLDPRKTPNIRSVQNPSPPMRDWKKTYKAMAMAAVGGVFGGIAWAFLIEMILDPSVKRPVEVERRLKLPLFLSIPNVNRNGFARLARTAERRQLAFKGEGPARTEKGNSHSSSVSNGNGHVISLDQNPLLQPFHQALRDRLILYFEVKNFTHKPKLVAVTGAGRGTGVSTIASGLAASLSETGDGNVLLVDMNLENGAAQQFYKGKACCGLDAVLASETKKNALVQENLYVVNGNTNSDGLSQLLPKRFTALVPKLKASDYDYIIFDMPVVNPSSVTSHLARFMDITLLVVESEKTGREIVELANAQLTEAGATVGVVLNKTHQYVPKQLQRDI
ncbi:MAG TPA: Wzz/FepE/Etk N-terminal domain-containing protein [Candidatus Acidoferrales bacterium]|nr:Wzz/FepE/Etk N-terminal domain-containing protein [Candidatus Acidoferrales bacterium]